MKMVRMTEEGLSSDQMQLIESYWPNTVVVQENRLPTTELCGYLDDFDKIAHDAHIVELDLSEGGVDLLKYVHRIIVDSAFWKRGGLLVRLVAYLDDHGDMKQRYEQIYKVAILSQPVAPVPVPQLTDDSQQGNVQRLPDKDAIKSALENMAPDGADLSLIHI